MSESNEPGVEVAKAVTIMVARYYPHNEKTLTSIMGGLASCLVTVGIACFGKERAPTEISEAINAALIGVGKIKDRVDEGGEIL